MKKTISLNGTWQLAGLDEGQGSWAKPENLLPLGVKETEGHVPGNVHSDLLQAGLIPEPFYGKNWEQLEWIGQKQWWYKQTFSIDEDFIQQQAILAFDGVIGSATVFFNGIELGKASNQFDVSDSVQVGRNTVALRFDPAEKDLVSVGIARGVDLVSRDNLSIADIHIETVVEGSIVNAWIAIEVSNYTKEDQNVMVSVVVAIGDIQEKTEIVDTISPFGGVIEAVIRIEEPQLWWPNGFGEQPLYSCSVGLQAEGEIQDVAQKVFGIRTVKIIQENENHVLSINNEEVFCKAADWAPTQCLDNRNCEDRNKTLAQLANQSGINLLRLRNGTYESKEFYEACDELGIMVWQDLASVYDSDTADADTRRKAFEEVRNVIKQLRNHPSIIVWGAEKESDLSRNIIPNVLSTLDDTRPFLRGNNAKWGGDYISAKGLPVIESVKEFIPEDQLFPPANEAWEYHNAQPELIERVRETMGDFESIEQFSVYSGILQGESLRSQIESYRQKKWGSSGVMLQSFNDNKPEISDSIVDYYLRPKIAYYYAKRAFAPILVSFEKINDSVRLHVTSDERTAGVKGALLVGILTFDTCGLDVMEVPINLAANTSQAFWESEPIDNILTDPTSQCLVAMLSVRGNMVAKSAYFARPLKEMRFSLPKLLIQREQIDEERQRITISADAYARNVAITNLPDSARISDNYFDLLPGELRELEINNATLDQVKAAAINVWRR